MKLKATLKLLGLLLLFSFSLSSCFELGKDEDNDDPEPEISCALSQLTYSYSDRQDHYFYDDDGVLERIEIPNNGNMTIWYYTYDGAGNLEKQEGYFNGELREYTVSTYANGRRTKAETYNTSGALLMTVTYSYDSKGNATEMVRTKPETNERFVMTYTAAGNVATSTYYYNGDLYAIYSYENYDDKKYYQSAVKGIPKSGVSANKNNYRKLTIEYYTDNAITETREFFYEYTYNDEGYPTMEVETYNDEVWTYYLLYNCN